VQAGYQPQPSCGCTANQTTYNQPAAPTQVTSSAPPANTAPATAPLQPEPRPTLDPNQQPQQAQNTTTNRPVETPVTPPPAQPAQPASSHPEYDVKKNDTGASDLKLFNPQDRTAQRAIAPVHTALYKQPASFRPVSTALPIVTDEQVHKDAAGWGSVSN
jgi:hypothetical protein